MLDHLLYMHYRKTSLLFEKCFPYLIQIFDRHVDGNSAQRVLKDLSCEVTRGHTGASALVKLRLVVIDVDDVDLYICCGAGIDPVDVLFRLSGLKLNKI